MNPKKYQFLIIVFILSLAFCTSCSDEPEDISIPITVINSTGSLQFYIAIDIRRPDTSYWSTLQIYSSNGTEHIVYIPFQSMSIENKVDIRLRFTSSAVYTKLSQTIKPNVIITFTSADAGS